MVGKKKGKVAERTLSTMENVINDAYKNGKISNDLYKELVRAGIQDTRPVQEVPDMWGTWAAPTAPPEEIVEVALLSTSPPPCDCEIVEVPGEDEPIVQVDECETELTPQAEERKSVVTHQVTERVESVRISGSGNKHPNTTPERDDGVYHEEKEELRYTPGERSNVFSCCTRCRGLGWAKSDKRNMLEDVVPGTKLGTAVVFFHCRTCAAQHREHEALRRTNVFATSFPEPDSEVKLLEVDPEMWQGIEALEIVRILIGSDVPVLGDGKGRTLLKTHKIWADSVGGDHFASIDVERYREGRRTNLVLPYLEGGFF